MALDARHRSSIYTKFASLIGEDDANALMSEFPATDGDTPATEQFVRAETSSVRSAVAELGSELRTEMADLGSELRTEMADLGSELRAEMADLRSELRTETSDLRVELRTEIAGVRTEMAEGFRRQQAWLLGAIAASTALVGTLTTLS